MNLFNKIAHNKPKINVLIEKNSNTSTKKAKNTSEKAPSKKRARVDEDEQVEKVVNKPKVSIKDKLAMFKKK